MLEGASGIRKGIDGLSMIIGDKYHQDPFEKGTLFLFCGRKADRIKGLLWMGNGFLLLYKRYGKMIREGIIARSEVSLSTIQRYVKKHGLKGAKVPGKKTRKRFRKSMPAVCTKRIHFTVYILQKTENAGVLTASCS